MSIEKSQKGRLPDDTYYDFQTRWLPLKILGFYVLLEKPFSYLVLNLLLAGSVAFLYFYIIAMTIYTAIKVPDNRLAKVKAIYTMLTILVALTFAAAKLLTLKTCQLAAQELKRGIFYYEDLKDEFDVLRRKRVRQIKVVIHYFAIAFLTVGFLSIISPLMKSMSTDDPTGQSLGPVNPYLPLPIMVTFDTTSPVGYWSTFIFESVGILFTHFTNISIEDMYIGGAVQLILECEVLSLSLRNIRKRAFLKFRRDYPNLPHLESAKDELPPTNEFQKCVNSCLRENILHHIAILRLKQLLMPYYEATNFLVLLMVSALVAGDLIIFLEDPKSQFLMFKELVGFFPLCLYGQVVIDKSSEVLHAIYETPWFFTNKNYSSLLKVFMANVQKPLELRVKVFAVVFCLETYANAVTLGYKLVNVIGNI